MATAVANTWVRGKPARHEPLPSDPFVRRPHRCECGAVAWLTLDQPLPMGWSVTAVRTWQHGHLTFRSWRYTCPYCRATQAHSA